MGVEIEGQTAKERQDVRTRELQQENMEKLNDVTDAVDNFNIDAVETDTKTIKSIVMNNLENQTDIDDIAQKIDKISQGIADIKRSQTNLNKKINDIQDQMGD